MEEKTPVRRRDSDDYDPHLYRNLPNPTSNMDTMFHLLKGSLGSGILAMPQAFSRVGMIMGCVGTVVLGAILTHCLHLLVKSEYIAAKLNHSPNITYPQAVITLTSSGPKPFRRLAHCAAISVDVFLVVYQLGICCVYMLFIADNMKKLIDPHFVMSTETYMLIILFPLILLNLIPNLKKLAPVSAFSNFVTVLGIFLVMYMTVAYKKKSQSPISHFGTLSEYPLFFGTTLFALTSVGVVVSAEANMQSPKDFVKPMGILNMAMVLVVLLYMALGAIGYAYCVDQCSDIITLDLPAGPLSMTVIILYIIAIFTSYALHCYVPFEILWRDYWLPSLERQHASTTRKRVSEYILRVGLCILTFAVTLAVPRLGLFISLFGALCLSTLAISYPAYMEICCFYPDRYGKGSYLLYKDIFLFFFGIVGLVAGTYTSLSSIVVSFM